MNLRITAGTEGRRARAFTLVELLVVISIIGLLMFIAVPAFKGFGRSNVMSAAQQQLRDDLSFARQQAITHRSPVYMVFFMPPNDFRGDFSTELNNLHTSLVNLPNGNDYDRQYREIALRAFTNTFPKQYASYALYTEGNVGEQPGVKVGRFLTDWRALPEGALFPTNGMEVLLPSWVSGLNNQIIATNLNSRTFPFPIAPERFSPDNAKRIKLELPALAFDSQGRLFNFDVNGRAINNGTTLADRYVAVGAGSVLLSRHRVNKGEPERFDFLTAADVVETPKRNYTNHIVRVSALTGRAKSLKPAP